MAKPKVLAACPPPSFKGVSRIIGGDAELLFTNSLPSARKLLRTPGLAMVICGVHFDESRMYDLLESARHDFPRLPFFVVRMLDWQGRRISMAALSAAAHAAGAVAVFDYAAASRRLGQPAADRALREAILRHLPRREGAS